MGVTTDGVQEAPAVAGAAAPFSEAVPGAVLEVTKGSLVVAPEKLLDLVTYLRDREGYDYLTMVTSVDWPGYLEVVYYLCGVAQLKDPLVLKVRLPDKSAPVVPSLVSVWPGADFQEREVYDLMGIRFDGHPNLRRILLWEGFEGHPLRKDYRESYYEEDFKPIKSRHPDGEHLWAEDRAP
jgi:NADH:ubiquinone oxidoreductase subunit C